MIKLTPISPGIYRYESAGVHVINVDLVGPIAHHWERIPPGWNVISSTEFSAEVKRHHQGQTKSGRKPTMRIDSFVLATFDTLSQARDWISEQPIE